jgi:two-component system KDP operon response regulator KdpE
MSGCEAALRISSFIDTKIIFLTAHSDQEMIDYALDAGAINYLIKPYKEKQIFAALQIALNQDQKTTPKYLKLKCGYSYSFETKKLYLDDSEISIGHKSLRLVQYLCEHSNDVISSEQLSQHVYGKEKDSSTLRTLIFRLKKNLNCDLVDNHSGVGYKIILC